MKKVFVVFAMSAVVLALATVKAEGMNNGSAANDANESIVEVDQLNPDTVIYKFTLRLRDMNKAMHLDVDQIEALQHTNLDLSRRIAHLEKVAPEKRQAMLTRIISENLILVHEHVNETQYRAYLNLLNDEFNKTGLNSVLYGYDMVAR